MRRAAIGLAWLALFLGAASCARFVKPERPYVPFTTGAEIWHGYPRHDFVLHRRHVTVVTPRRVAKGVPWVWRASFFHERPEVEEALLKVGFHVVYVEAIDLCGSPEAVALWDDVYDLLTHEHGLSPRPALTAISRGALIAYNWAEAHPDRVACGPPPASSLSAPPSALSPVALGCGVPRAAQSHALLLHSRLPGVRRPPASGGHDRAAAGDREDPLTPRSARGSSPRDPSARAGQRGDHREQEGQAAHQKHE